MVVTVNYEDGKVVRVVTDPSEHIETDMCATRESLKLVDGSLLWIPQVLSSKDGRWHAPVHKEVSRSYSTSRVRLTADRWSSAQSDTDIESVTEYKESPYCTSYVLVNAKNMAGAVAINIDGALAYAINENGALSPVADYAPVEIINGGCTPHDFASESRQPARNPANTPTNDYQIC